MSARRVGAAAQLIAIAAVSWLWWKVATQDWWTDEDGFAESCTWTCGAEQWWIGRFLFSGLMLVVAAALIVTVIYMAGMFFAYSMRLVREIFSDTSDHLSDDTTMRP